MIARYMRPAFIQKCQKILGPWLAMLSTLCLSIGYVWALGFGPDDFQQGSMIKLLYIHVPTAWYALACYTTMGIMSAIYLIGRLPVAFFIGRACGIVGICFTGACLITGMAWGKPMWGTWWVWDARLTSMFILFFIYAGVLILYRAFSNRARAIQASSILALIGLINIPIIKWSVDWWYTLHQPASIMKFSAPSIHPSMLWPLLICAVGWGFYAAFIALMHTTVTLKQEKMHDA